MTAHEDATAFAHVLARAAHHALTHTALANDWLGLTLDRFVALAGLRLMLWQVLVLIGALFLLLLFDAVCE